MRGSRFGPYAGLTARDALLALVNSTLAPLPQLCLGHGTQQFFLQLWDLETGEVLLQLFQKAFSREAWPAIQLTADEGLAFHAQPNSVNVYNPRDFAAGMALLTQECQTDATELLISCCLLNTASSRSQHALELSKRQEPTCTGDSRRHRVLRLESATVHASCGSCT